jgi:broad specificity phosphatase PhoE
VSTQQSIRRDPTGQRFDRFRSPTPNTTTELVLVRHGQTAANIAGLLVGRQDVLLTDLGHEQARRAAAAVHDLRPDALVSSPLQRARQTAAPIAERTLLLPTLEDDIAEFGFGDFEGWAEKDAIDRHPHLRPLLTGEAHPDERWPNGESGSLFVARIFAGIGRIVAEHPDQRVIVVTHGGVIGSWVARMATEGATSFFPYLVSNCSISTFEITDRGTTCVSWNRREHLDGLTGHER